MAQCQTGKNRMKALLPFGTPVEHKTGTLNGLADDVGFITMPDGRRVAVAIFARGGSNRPRTIAEAARTIYDGFKSVFSLAVPARAHRAVGAAPHRCSREDRPLSGGRSGRALSQADRLADQGDRAARPRRQGSRALPRDSVTIVLDERGQALSSMRAGEEARRLARRRQARGAVPDRRRRRA